MNTIASLASTNQSAYVTLGGGGSTYRSYSFAGNDDYLIKTELYAYRYGSPTGKLYAKVYAHTGTYGTSSEPTGAPLATSQPVDISQVDATNYTQVPFVFTGDQRIQLETGTNYCMVIEYVPDFTSASDFFVIGVDGTTPAYAGNPAYSSDGTTWTTTTTYDICFIIYGVDDLATISDQLTHIESGNNTASTSWAITVPQANEGDLIIVHLAWDNSTDTTAVTPGSGQNSETAVEIEPVRASGATACRGAVWYYQATAVWKYGTITYTPNASEQWTAIVTIVPKGLYDPSDPIGAHNYLADSAVSNPSLPSLTAGSTDGDGLVVAFLSSDTDDADGSITGWTSHISRDRGAIGADLLTRNTLATSSESISAATGLTYPTARRWVSFIYILRSAGDFSNGYEYRREVTIDYTKVSGSANLTDITIPIAGTYSYLKSTSNGGKVYSTDGDDIRFENQLGEKLSHDLAHYNPATGEVEIWVKIPLLSYTADTTIYIYYGNAGADAEEDKVNAWHDDFDSVYHLNEDLDGTSGEVKDSKGSNDGTGGNGTANECPTQTTGVTGITNQGQTFDPTSYQQHINFGNVHNIGHDDKVCIAFAKTGATTSNQWIVAKSAYGSITGRWAQLGFGSDGNLTTLVQYSSTNYQPKWTDSPAHSDDAWRMYTSRVDRSANLELLVDGDSKSTVDISSLGSYDISGTMDFLIACYNDPDGTGRHDTYGAWNGEIDEVWVLTGYRSDDWLVTVKNAVLSPATFYEVGDEEPVEATTQTKTVATKARIQQTASKTVSAKAKIRSGTHVEIDTENKSSQQANTSNTITFSHTVTGGEDRLLLVNVATRGGKIASVTFDGDNLTKIQETGVDSNTENNSSQWYLLDPEVKTANIVVTRYYTNNTQCVAANAVTLYNVDQDDPYTNEKTNAYGGSTVSTTQDDNSVSTSVIIDSLSFPDNGSGATPEATNQTELYVSGVTGDTRGCSSYVVGDGTAKTIEWTIRNELWRHCICEFQFASDITTQTKTTTAKARIATTGVIKTTATKARIEQTQSKTTSTKARIEKTETKTTSSKARIQQVATKTASTKARIETTEAKTVAVLARVKQTTTKTAATKARIASTGAVKTVAVQARIEKTTSKTVATQARIEQTTAKTSNAKARITQAGVAKTASSKARIVRSESKTVAAKARVEQTTSKTAEAKARIQHTRTVTTTAKARIEQIAQKTTTAKARVEATTTKTTATKARIATTGVVKSIEAKARVKKTEAKTVQAKARIEKTLAKTTQALARIELVSQRTTNARARIETTTTATTTAKARIQRVEAVTTTAKTRIEKTATKTIQTKARIQHTRTKTVQTKARIQKTLAKTTTTKARVQKTLAKTTTAKAKIVNTYEQTVAVKARIATTGLTKAVAAKARIQKTNAKTVGAKANIQLVKTWYRLLTTLWQTKQSTNWYEPEPKNWQNVEK